MSLESALDEERREVMDILEGRTGPTRGSSGANSTAFGPNGRTASPPAPVRSMLDIGGPAVSSHTPGPGRRAGAGATSPPPNRSSKPPSVRSVRSLLDPDSTGPPPTLYTHSATTSPIQPYYPSGGLHRAQSDASAHPPDGRLHVSSDRDRGVNLNSDYQFEMLPSIASHALPKRVTQGGKKSSILPSAMASIMQGQELGALPRGRDRGRHNSTAGLMGGKSKSPSSRLGNRSQSPGGSMLNTNSFNLMPTPGKFVTDGGKVIDLSNAYRRLSDAALLKSGGNLSNLPVRQGAERRIHADSGEVLSPTGGIRLQKDYYHDGDGEAAIESSDEDKDASSGDERWGPENLRGRRRSRKKREPGSAEADWEDSDNEGSQKSDAGGTLGMGRTPHPRKVKSLLAAAEEERLSISSQYKVRSLLEPTVTVTGPGGERLAAKKQGVHPSTSYDHTASGPTSPMTSDTEAELTDIRRAQRMSVNISPIDNSIEHRLIRTVIRGEFSQMQQEAEEGSRRLRTYLVATDLSDEAAYALEWTIGIVLRDGDTLIAVYAIDEESVSGKGGDGESVHGVGIGEGAKAMQDMAAAIGSLTAAATQNANAKAAPSPLSAGSLLPGTDSKGGSVDSRNMSRAETERYRAIEDISQRCIRLVRKTKLQVRIAVEVIHCKSAKRLITEAIDGLEPTMVILGSRGRSALKGVLLGSFSNYLVTKSSVPVMVARRRLRKHAKDRKINPRLSNNLTNPSRLETAKID